MIMGYYTYFNLSMEYRSEGLRPRMDIPANLADRIFEDLDAKGWFSDLDRQSCTASVYTKWGDFEVDMANFSAAYPDVLFVINGYGENNEDIWTGYFYRGKYDIAYAEIVYPEFDMMRLRPVDQTDRVLYTVRFLSEQNDISVDVDELTKHICINKCSDRCSELLRDTWVLADNVNKSRLAAELDKLGVGHCGI